MEKTNYMKYWPVAVFLFGFAVAQGRNEMHMSAMAEDLKEAEALAKDNDKVIRALRETDIRTEGRVALQIQELNSNIAAQSAKIDLLIQAIEETQE